ncbi:MAG: CPBP family intramembrane metalloprotease [Ruminococcaceae bacterium]|nr:CPBP family intramembrane metalloprotease [Oscillospiraceae bacterium]
MYMSYIPAEKPSPPIQYNPEGELKRSVVKLAAFALITVINHNFIYYVFLYPALILLSYLPEGTSPAVYYAVQWIVNDISVYLFPTLAAYLLFRNDLKTPFRYQKHSTYIPALSITLIFFALCFVGSLATIISNFVASVLDALFGTGEIPDAMSGVLPQNGSMSTFVVLILTTAVVAPVCEELIFRKLLLQPLRKHGDGFAIVTTALLFGFTHGNFDQLPYAFIVGLLFGLLAVNSSSVIPTMFLHTLNNFLVTVGSYSVSILGENSVTLALENGISIFLNFAFWAGIPAIIIIFASGMHKSDYVFQLSKAEKAKIIFTTPASYFFAAGLVLMMMDLQGIVFNAIGI